MGNELVAGEWRVDLDDSGAIARFGAPNVDLIPPGLQERWVRIEIGGRRIVLDRPVEVRRSGEAVTYRYELTDPSSMSVELTYRVLPLPHDGIAIEHHVRLVPRSRITQDVVLRVSANLRLPGARQLFAPRKDGTAIRRDLTARFDWQRLDLDWVYELAGRARTFMGPGPQPLAVPMISESAEGPWRLTWAADPYMTTRFVPSRATMNGELNVVFDGAVGLAEPEERSFFACLHRGDERSAFDALYATALRDVPPGPGWLHDIAWVHYDFLADGGKGWMQDVDRLVATLPRSELARVFMCLHGWYDWLGIYAYDDRTGRLRRRWKAVSLDHPDQTRPAPRDVFSYRSIDRAHVRSLLRYARDRGIRVGLYFGDGLAADGGKLGREFAEDEVLDVGGYEAGRGPTSQLNPLHPSVRSRFHGYMAALLDTFGNDLDAFVWDETYYVDPGRIGPLACPGYADRAFMRLVRDLAAQAHAYRADIAFLTSDCIGVPGFERKAPYALVADGSFQDTGCRPDAWPYGAFPNERNVLWSCNWYPLGNIRLTAYGVDEWRAPVSTANGFIEDRGPGDYSSDELRRFVDLFDRARANLSQPMRWLTEDERATIASKWPI